MCLREKRKNKHIQQAKKYHTMHDHNSSSEHSYTVLSDCRQNPVYKAITAFRKYYTTSYKIHVQHVRYLYMFTTCSISLLAIHSITVVCKLLVWMFSIILYSFDSLLISLREIFSCQKSPFSRLVITFFYIQ